MWDALKLVPEEVRISWTEGYKARKEIESREPLDPPRDKSTFWVVGWLAGDIEMCGGPKDTQGG